MHVVESAQRVKVVLFVVGQRRFLAEPSKQRIRVGVEFDVVGVVEHLTRSLDTHESATPSIG
jgi:hypothetical protein